MAKPTRILPAKRFRILSDGTEKGSDIVGPDGKHVPGVRRVSVVLEAGRRPVIVLELDAAEVDVLGIPIALLPHVPGADNVTGD